MDSNVHVCLHGPPVSIVSCTLSEYEEPEMPKVGFL